MQPPSQVDRVTALDGHWSRTTRCPVKNIYRQCLDPVQPPDPSATLCMQSGFSVWPVQLCCMSILYSNNYACQLDTSATLAPLGRSTEKEGQTQRRRKHQNKEKEGHAQKRRSTGLLSWWWWWLSSWWWSWLSHNMKMCMSLHCSTYIFILKIFWYTDILLY